MRKRRKTLTECMMDRLCTSCHMIVEAVKSWEKGGERGGWSTDGDA